MNRTTPNKAARTAPAPAEPKRADAPVKTDDAILTPEEVAELLKVPPTWVYEKTRQRCQNPIPCLRIGRYIRFRLSAVEAWLGQQSTERAA